MVVQRVVVQVVQRVGRTTDAHALRHSLCTVLFPIPYTEAGLCMLLIHNEKDISPRLRSGLS